MSYLSNTTSLTRARHCRRFLFPGSVGHVSTFLRPFAPSPLRDFTATMDALTPAGPALRFSTSNMNTVSVPRQVSLIHVSDLATPPSPPPRPSTPISHATPHLVECPACAGLGFTICQQARRH